MKEENILTSTADFVNFRVERVVNGFIVQFNSRPQEFTNETYVFNSIEQLSDFISKLN